MWGEMGMFQISKIKGKWEVVNNKRFLSQAINAPKEQRFIPVGILEVLTRNPSRLKEGIKGSRLIPLKDRQEAAKDFTRSKKDKAWAMKMLKDGNILDASFSEEAHVHHYTTDKDGKQIPVTYAKRWDVPVVTLNSADLGPDMSIRFSDKEHAKEFVEMVEMYRGLDALNEARREEFQQAYEDRLVTRGGVTMAGGIADLMAEETARGQKFSMPEPGLKFKAKTRKAGGSAGMPYRGEVMKQGELEFVFTRAGWIRKELANQITEVIKEVSPILDFEPERDRGIVLDEASKKYYLGIKNKNYFGDPQMDSAHAEEFAVSYRNFMKAVSIIKDIKKNHPGIPSIYVVSEQEGAASFNPMKDRIEIGMSELIMSRMTPYEDLESVLLHEAVGHREIHSMFGYKYADFMLDIYNDLGGYKKLITPEIDGLSEILAGRDDAGIYGWDQVPELEAKLKENKITPGELDILNDLRTSIAEEFIAYSSEYGPTDLTLWEMLVAKIKDFLRQAGFNPAWTEKDIDFLINKAFKNAQLPMNEARRVKIRETMHYEKLSRASSPPHRKDLSFPDMTPEQLALMSKDMPAANPKGIKDMTHNIKKTFIDNIFDAYAPVADQIGQAAYQLVRLAKRKDGVLMAMLQFGGLKVKEKTKLGDMFVNSIDVDESLPGFFNSLKPLGTESERVRFFRWLSYNRAAQNYARNKEHWYTADEISVGKTLNQGSMKNAETKRMESREKIYKQIQKDFNRYNQSIMKIGVQFGVFGENVFKDWETQFYVPFWREIERQIGDRRGLRGPVSYNDLVNVRSPVYELKGADMKIKDPFNNIIQNWSNILDAALKNQAGFESVNQAVKITDPTTGKKLAEKVEEPTHRSIHVLVNGKKIHYHINNQQLYDALNSVHQGDMNIPGLDWAVKAKRWLTIGITSSPDFKIRNAIRDSVTVMGTTDVGFNIAKNFFGGFQSLKDREFKGRMLASGGYMQFGLVGPGDKKYAEKMLSRDLDMAYILNNPEANQNLLQAWAKHGRIFGRLWSRYQDWGDQIENANRAALFRKKIGEGKSDLEAAYYARDVLDFSLNGKSQFIRSLIATVPFANALLQSKYKFFRSAKDPSIRAAFYTTVLGVASLSLAEYEMYGDDEDWRAREEWDKDTFFWFKIPGTETAFRIPKPHEFSILGNMAWRMIDVGFKDDPITRELFTSSMKHMLTNEFYITPLPQIITPVAELVMDRDFFTGRPIEGLMAEFQSPAERRRLYTSSTAIAASRELFSKLPIDALRLSPIQLEHLLKGYTGFLGETALFVSDLFVSRAYDMPSTPMRRITDYPVAKSFFQRTPLRNTMYGNVIYQHFKTIEQAYSDISTARRIGDFERAGELEAENQEALYWKPFLAANKRRMADISTRIKIVRNSRYLDPEAKRHEIERLEQIRNLIAKQTVETVLR